MSTFEAILAVFVFILALMVIALARIIMMIAKATQMNSESIGIVVQMLQNGQNQEETDENDAKSS